MPVLSHFRGISGDKKKVSARLLIKLSGVRIPDVSLKSPVNKRVSRRKALSYRGCFFTLTALFGLSGDKFKSKCLKNVSVISKEPAEAGSLQGKRKNKILREFSAALWKLRRVSYENILAVC